MEDSRAQSHPSHTPHAPLPAPAGAGSAAAPHTPALAANKRHTRSSLAHEASTGSSSSAAAAATPAASHSARRVTRATAAAAAVATPASALASPSSLSSASSSRRSKRNSGSDVSQRAFSPFSAGAADTPATTAFSTPATVPAFASSSRAQKKRSAPQDPEDEPAPSVAAASPSRASKTRASARSLRSSASTLSASTSSKGKKRQISPEQADPAGPSTSESSRSAKRQRHSDGGAYNLRSRASASSLAQEAAPAEQGSASSSRRKTRSSMSGPRVSNSSASGSTADAAGSSAGGSRAAAVAAKGKSKARGSGARGSRAAATRSTSEAPRLKAECDDDQMEVDVEAGAAEAEVEAKYSFSEISGSHSPEGDEDEGEGEGDYDEDEDVAADSGASPFGALQMDEDDEDDEDDEGPYDDEDDMDDPYGDGGLGAAGAYGQLRAMAGYMSGLSGRFRTLLASLRNYGDPTIQLVALQELSEVLSMSNEDTLAGYFPLESFVRELIFLMGGPKPNEAGAAGAAAEDSGDEEERLNAAAIAAATAEDNGEAALLACRCLANLIEAMPYAAHQVVGMGLLPVLLSKLKEIQFIDLAEQVLQTLEKISAEYPTAIVREGGLLAMLQFIDFFGVHVQRTAMQAAAHCCRKLGEDSFAKVREVMPIIQNVLGYADQRLVDSACKCVVRAVESYRHHGELLEQLLTGELLSAVNAILLPGSATGASGGSGGGSGVTTVSTSTYTDILKMLSTAAHASPKVAVMLLEHNIVETLYLLLTGSPAPAEDGSGGRGPAALDAVPGETEGAGGAASGSAEAAPIAVVAQASDTAVVDSVAVADVAVLQNLAQRPKEQVQEALSLVGELMPPLPRDGIFDARAYSEKAYLRKKSRDAKNARAAQRARAAAAKGGSLAIKQEPGAESADAAASSSAAPPQPSVDVPIKSERVKTERELAKESAQAKRVEMLTERKGLVKRFTQLVLPTLVEVYAASVALHVRTKALSGILKIVSFVEAEPLSEVLDNVPLASFAASILSARDNPTLVLGALQMVELLNAKLPSVYSAALRREGVVWEIEDIADKEPSASTVSASSSSKLRDDKSAATSAEAAPPAQTALETLMGHGRRADDASLEASRARLMMLREQTRELADAGARLLAAAGGSGRKPPLNSAEAAAAAATEQEDANIWRARLLRDRFNEDVVAGGTAEGSEALRALDNLQALSATLGAGAVDDEAVAAQTLQAIAPLFSARDSPISSFELLRSGLVDALYEFAVGDSAAVPTERRRTLLLDALMASSADGGSTAAAALVRRLQETLSRLEKFEITAAITSGGEDTRRSPTANVSRAVRLKLVADGNTTGIPRTCQNALITIHAIAPFQAVNDYLRPKIAAGLAGGPAAIGGGAGAASRLSGMLAAMADSGLELPPGLAAAAAAVAAGGRRRVPASDAPAAAASSAPEASASSAAAAPASSSSAAEKPRRSSRLSGAGADSTDSAPAEAEAAAEGPAATAAADASGGEGEDSTAEARRIVESFMGAMDEDDELGGDFDEEDIIDDAAMEEFAERAGDTSASSSNEDRTVNLKVAGDASAASAGTPAASRSGSGSNAAAPAASASAASGSGAEASSAPKPSYASMAQKQPNDWHLVFEVGGQPVSLDSTIYRAIHNFEMTPERQATGLHRHIWNNVYTVKFRRVDGPAPAPAATAATPEPEDATSTAVALPSSVAEDASFAKILQLLSVLHELNAEWRQDASRSEGAGVAALSEAAFVNNKLTAKLNRQLEEPLVVASMCLPDWALELPKTFPFLFPFEARYAFLQNTAFDCPRLIARWQTQQSRHQDPSSAAAAASRTDDARAVVGRLSRQKVRIGRQNIFGSALKVFELYGSSSALLEIEYFDEVGTGLGPTLEFYALVSKEFARKDLGLWRDDGAGAADSRFVSAKQGLFPAVADAATRTAAQAPDSEAAKTNLRLQSFVVLGQFVAKALLDSRIIDVHFSPVFLRAALLNKRVPETLATLALVDAGLARSMQQLLSMPRDDVEALGLDFTLPGRAEYELHAGGASETVSGATVAQYVAEVCSHTLVQGVRPYVRAFRRGFNGILPLGSMASFSADELVLLFGNTDEDWSEPTLLAAIKPDHGFTGESAAFRDVVALMAGFSHDERRRFLQWLTGSPKLPIGGLAGLHPQLTIVKRPHEAPLTPDDYLPSVMTCVNYLKLPAYSSRDVMRRRLETAMREGGTSFHLS